MIDITKLKRDADYIRENLVTSNSGVITTKKDILLMVPSHFEAKGLLSIGMRNYSMGYFAVIMDDKYAVMILPAMIELDPRANITKEKINNVEYYVFAIDAGSTFIVTDQVFKKKTIVYFVVNEFIMQGKIPWYYTYDDIGRLFHDTSEFADITLYQREEVGEILAAMITRDPKDRTRHYRLTDFKDKPAYVGLTSVFFSATNTVNKICGNYFSDGIVSALVTPTEEVSNIEKILRA